MVAAVVGVIIVIVIRGESTCTASMETSTGIVAVAFVHFQRVNSSQEIHIGRGGSVAGT